MVGDFTLIPLRTCKYCGIEAITQSDLENFVGNKPSAHGRANRCKRCDSEKGKHWREKNPQRRKQYYQDNRERVLNAVKQWRQNNREKYREYNKQWRKDNPEWIREYSRLVVKFKGRPIQLKVNSRTGFCQICGKTERENGRQHDMHHDKYVKNDPLAYTTEMCRGCHRKLHNQQEVEA